MSDAASTFDDIDNLDHAPELASALGNLVVAWATAETAICFAFARISGMSANQTMMGFYRIPTFESRVKTTMALLNQ